MSGPPRVRSMNVADTETRSVLGPAGNKARLVAAARKPAAKPLKKVEEEKKASPPLADSRLPLSPAMSAPAVLKSAPRVLKRHELLLNSNLSLNASCSSDASTDSFCSRASTGRMGRTGFPGRRKTAVKPEKIAAKLERVVPDGVPMPIPEVSQGKRSCAWVTPNTDPCYAAFHDEEWGVPVHDDKKLFELLVLSGALAELTWPVILNKRHLFREVFMDFDPELVSKLNEKKLVAPGSTASSLLSEVKLRAVTENARQVLKIMEEFGSFDRYCWSFVNHKPIVSRFRYARQVPVKTPKADVISKDLIRRGFRSVGPTVIYTFMQAAGITNDHLLSCFRFEECTAAATTVTADKGGDAVKAKQKLEEKTDAVEVEELRGIDIDLSIVVDGLSVS